MPGTDSVERFHFALQNIPPEKLPFLNDVTSQFSLKRITYFTKSAIGINELIP